jgi:hypothetical protein
MNRFNVLLSLLCMATSPAALSSPKEAHAHDLGYDLPTDASKSEFAVKGEFGGKIYFETAVPRYVLTVDGALREDGTVPVGTVLRPKNFIRFRGVNHYELTDLPKGKKSLQPRYFVDGRFVSIK